jgi:hypothetical protein
VVKSSGEVTQREVRAWVKDEVGDLDLSQLDLDREQFQYNKILQIGIKTTVTGLGYSRVIKKSPPSFQCFCEIIWCCNRKRRMSSTMCIEVAQNLWCFAAGSKPCIHETLPKG